MAKFYPHEGRFYTFKLLLIETIQAGFAEVAEAIRELKPLPLPQPAQKGEIVARFRVPADQPDVIYTLIGRGFADSEGNPTGAGDIDLSLEVTNPHAVTVSIGPQTISADRSEVSAEVTLHFESPQLDQTVVVEKATNRDTDVVTNTRTNEYIVGPGEATTGALVGDIPLVPEQEPPPPLP